jgi:hypothetical protein
MATRSNPAFDPDGSAGALGGLSAPNGLLGAPGGLPDTTDRAIPTGFRAVDAILGLGGLPRAATTALCGDGTSGVTTLALQAIAQIQAVGGIAAYLDLAQSLDPVEAVARGVQLDWFVVLRPDSLAEALAMAAMLLQDRTVDVLLLDLPPRPLEGAGISSSAMAERFGRLAALARRAGVGVLVLEPPSLPSALTGALSQIAALRLELSRRAWIRLGRDVVGQRTEVRVARDRFAPPGRAAQVRILYADGGLRDACLARGELLRESAPGTGRPAGTASRVAAAPHAGVASHVGAALHAGVAPPGISRPSAITSAVRSLPPLHLTAIPVPDDATPPPLLAPPSPSPGSQQSLRAIRGGAAGPGRQALDERRGPGCESVGARAGHPARDAARGRS